MGGRGRGKGLSFNLESLGIMRGEALPISCNQPPPAFPILEHHPAPLVLTPTSVVQLSYKVDFLNHFSKEVKSLNYPWDYFPYELRPGIKKRKASSDAPVAGSSKKSASIAPTNIDQLLAHLEKNETTQVKVEVEEKEKADDGEEEEEEEYNETDEEMDNGTDYNQNYFDNGDGYLDDDEDMDEGPTY